jgi:hypothetical protein
MLNKMTLNKTAGVIKDVFIDNFIIEMENLSKLLDRYKYIAMVNI